MTDKYPGSTGNGERDELADKLEEMWEVGPETEGDVVNVEDAAVRPVSSKSPRPDGSPYFPDKPPTQAQIDEAARHGFANLGEQAKYYNTTSSK